VCLSSEKDQRCDCDESDFQCKRQCRYSSLDQQDDNTDADYEQTNWSQNNNRQQWNKMGKQCDCDATDFECKRECYQRLNQQYDDNSNEDDKQTNCNQHKRRNNQWNKNAQQCDECARNDYECKANCYGRQQLDSDTDSCTVYRNKIQYGSGSSRSYNPFSLSSVFNRLSYSRVGNDQDADNYDVVDSYTQNYGSQVCFSVEPVRQCSSECQAKNQQRESIRYHCVGQNSYEAKQLLSMPAYQRQAELRGKQVHKVQEEYVPTYCQAY